MFDNIRKTYKRIRKKKIIGPIIDLLSILVMFLIAGGIGVFLAFSKYAGNPVNFTKDYFGYYIYQNWQSMYNSFDERILKEGGFIDIDAFVKKMETDAIYGDFSEAKIEVTKQTKSKTYLKVRYEDKETGEKYSFDVVLIKQKEKQYKFFPTWKVDPTEFIAEDYTISVPKGTEVTLDGNKITNWLSTSTDTTDTYVIPRVFKGAHDIGINTTYIDSYTQTDYVEESGSTFMVKLEDFEMKQEDVDYVKSTATKVVFGMYSNVFGKAGVGDLETYFMQDELTLLELNDCYANLESVVRQEDGKALIDISVSDYMVYTVSYIYPNHVEVIVDFRCDFNAKTARSIYGGNRKDYSGTAQSKVTLTYELDGMVWRINEIDLKCIDY